MRFLNRKAPPTLQPTGPLIVVDYPRLSPTGIATNTTLVIVGVAFALPLLWLVLAAVDKNADWSIRLPNLTIENFRAVLTAHGLQPFVNSLYLALVTTVVATGFALLSAYTLSRRHVPGKRTVMLLVLFASGLPVTMMLVPILSDIRDAALVGLQVHHLSVFSRERAAIRDLAAEELYRRGADGA